MDRKIIHLDLDAFFCAVEALRDRSHVDESVARGSVHRERRVEGRTQHTQVGRERRP